MSTLIASLSTSILTLVGHLPTSRATWTLLKKAFSCSSNTRIMEIHMKLHNVEQRDDLILVYLQRAKSYSDALAAAGHSLLSGF